MVTDSEWSLTRRQVGLHSLKYQYKYMKVST